jgi:putative transposase
VDRAADWAWSSTRVHLGHAADDGLTNPAPVLVRYPDFAELIAEGEDEVMSRRLRQAETVGRPLGAEAFIARLEAESGRALRPRPRGRKALR